MHAVYSSALWNGKQLIYCFVQLKITMHLSKQHFKMHFVNIDALALGFPRVFIFHANVNISQTTTSTVEKHV